MIIIRLRRWDNHGRALDIRTDLQRSGRVFVTQSTSINDGSPKPPKIGWPSYSDASPDDTREFAALLTEAARVAGLLPTIEKWDHLDLDDIATWKDSGELPAVIIAEGVVRVVRRDASLFDRGLAFGLTAGD